MWSGTSFAAPVFAGQLAAALATRLVADDGTDRVALMRELLDGMPGAREKRAPEFDPAEVE